MRIRDERGAVSAAEGCIFAAVALFVLLLIALLVIAAIRFSHPPEGIPMGAAPSLASARTLHA
jgi:hypothetical protein